MGAPAKGANPLGLVAPQLIGLRGGATQCRLPAATGQSARLGEIVVPQQLCLCHEAATVERSSSC